MPLNNKTTVLIAGGSGLVGSYLSDKLLRSGFIVSHLSRSVKNTNSTIKSWNWNPSENYIHPEALLNQDYIINLSGAGIADKYWSKKRKQEILNSRIQSTKLLVEQIIKLNLKPKKFISASAIGFYGNQPNIILNEESSAGNDFLADVCQEWEVAVQDLEKQKVDTSIVRIGVVLANKGGFLSNISKSLKYHISPIPGSGTQKLNWIHIEDLAEIFKAIVENNFPDKVYNATALENCSFIDFQRKLCQKTNSKVFEFKLNRTLLKFLLGEFSSLFINRQDISSAKLKNQGYNFKYKDIDHALSSLLNLE